MGEVFEAEGPGGRRVALKLLTRTRRSESVERFLREAEMLARVRHPNVLVVHELGRDPAGPYLVTEMVEGQALNEVISAGALPPCEAATLLRDLSRAVGALHQAGVLHRDLKPENVIVRPDGSPVLLDFGLAREIGGSALTQTGQMLGTPSYLSPEQARGVSPATLDARVDVYGLGGVLYCCLTGAPPHAHCDSLPQLIGAILHGDLAPPSDLVSAVPRALDAVALRAMAKEPDERYASAEELAEDLQRVLDGVGTLAGHRLLSRRAALLGALSLFAILSLVLLALVLYSRSAGRRLTPDVSPAPPRRDRLQQRTSRRVNAPPKTHGLPSLQAYRLLRGWLLENPTHRQARATGARLEALVARPLATFPAPRGEAAKHALTFLSGERLAVSTRGALRLFSLGEGRTRSLAGLPVTHPDYPGFRALASVGRTSLAVRGGEGVYVLDAEALAADRVRVETLFAKALADGPLAASADGAWLAVGERTSVTLHALNDPGSPGHVELGQRLACLGFAGDVLVTVAAPGKDQLSISVWDPAATSEPLRTLECFGASAVVAGQPSGAHAVVGTSSAQLHWLATRSDAPYRSLPSRDVAQSGFISGNIAHRGSVRGVVFVGPDRFCSVSPVLQGEGGELRRWRISEQGVPVTEGQALLLPGDPQALAAEPSLGLVAVLYHDGSCEVWGDPFTR